MDAAEATPLGAWTSIRGYFTPTTLFLVLNLVIGTIALTSRSHQRRRREHHPHDYAPHHHHQGQYQEPVGDPHQQQQEYPYYQYQQQQTQYATPPPAPLARTSSIMDRLRSIGLYRFRSGDFPPEYSAGNTAAATGAIHDVFAPVVEEETTMTTELAAHYARSRSEPAPAREVVKKSGTEVVRSLRQEPSSPRKAEYQLQEEHVPPPAPMRAPPPLSRTSSVLDRLRSLGLYSFLAAEQPAAAAATPATDPAAGEKKQAHAHYDRSRSEPAAREQGKKEKTKQVAEARMGKSSSTARKPAAASSFLEEDCVDARAEAFIDSFRKEQSQKQAVAVHHDEDDHAVVPPPPAPLARTSSVLDRLRSFSLYLRSVDAVAKDPVKAPSAEEKKQQAEYGRSRSEPAREQGKKKTRQQGAAAQAKVSKTSSEAAATRNRSAEEAAPRAEECVDARADDFINKFRQQLQLQRLNSLLSYKQQQ